MRDSTPQNMHVRPIKAEDRFWVRAFIQHEWGSEIVVAHGTAYQPHKLPGFVATSGNEYQGLLTYHIDGQACEIVTVNSRVSNRGIGSALLKAVKQLAHHHKCRRLWLVTTNDNLNALRFYQKKGFELVKIHRHAVKESRKIKPQIPSIGCDGIPIRDEIELEQILS